MSESSNIIIFPRLPQEPDVDRQRPALDQPVTEGDTVDNVIAFPRSAMQSAMSDEEAERARRQHALEVESYIAVQQVMPRLQRMLEVTKQQLAEEEASKLKDASKLAVEPPRTAALYRDPRDERAEINSENAFLLTNALVRPAGSVAVKKAVKTDQRSPIERRRQQAVDRVRTQGRTRTHKS